MCVYIDIRTVQYFKFKGFKPASPLLPTISCQLSDTGEQGGGDWKLQLLSPGPAGYSEISLPKASKTKVWKRI